MADWEDHNLTPGQIEQKRRALKDQLSQIVVDAPTLGYVSPEVLQQLRDVVKNLYQD